MNETDPTDVAGLSIQDERANAVTHGLGAFLSLVATAILATHPDAPPISMKIASMVYAVAMGVVYFCSTMSHAIFEPRERHWWRAMDQGTIYCLISATYTPFIWIASPPGWRVPLLVAVWLAAIVGLYSKVVVNHRVNHSSPLSYVFLGWLPAIPLFQRTPTESLYWMVAGGLAYTIGIFFLVSDRRVRYFHAVWHLAVITGSTCHFIAIYRLASIAAAVES